VFLFRVDAFEISKIWLILNCWTRYTDAGPPLPVAELKQDVVAKLIASYIINEHKQAQEKFG
jgi:hypothetical protein